MSQRTRQLILGASLVATLAAVWWVDDDPPVPAPRHARVASAPTVASGAAPGPVPAEARTAVQPAIDDEPKASPAEAAGESAAPPSKDPFRSLSWYVPPPPSAETLKPKAPPLPFKYLGKVSDDDGIRLFLSHNNQYLVARVGDLLAGNYRIERIDGGQVVFLYQPLKERQTLDFGDGG